MTHELERDIDAGRKRPGATPASSTAHRTNNPVQAIPALQRAVGNGTVGRAPFGPASLRSVSGASIRAEMMFALQRAVGNGAVASALSGPARGGAAVDGRGLDEDEAGSDDRTDGGVDAGTEQDGGLPGGVPFPLPIAVRNGPGHSPIDTASAAGMMIDITLTSSSGNDADMANVLDSEQVSTSFNHTGSYSAVPPGNSSNSGYMPGYPIPPDHHSEPKARIIDCADNHGGNGSMDRLQLDSYKAPGGGVTDPTVVPNSGYLIRRTITTNGNEIKFRVDKSPQACTVNGFTTDAGPSPAQGDEVTVRPA
jgi:hypothetical protein